MEECGLISIGARELFDFSLNSPVAELDCNGLITLEFAGKRQKSSAGKLITEPGSRERQRIYGSGTPERGVNLSRMPRLFNRTVRVKLLQLSCMHVAPSAFY